MRFALISLLVASLAAVGLAAVAEPLGSLTKRGDGSYCKGLLDKCSEDSDCCSDLCVLGECIGLVSHY